MADVETAFFRSQLLERRHRLESVKSDSADRAYISQLFQEVDSALARLEQGTFGLCEACHEAIEEDRLLADPLVSLCLDHLTVEQKNALEQDLELAQQIQTKLLPGHHRIWNGWETYYHYEPANLVSGDFCDLVDSGNDAEGLFFLTGDVSGKGVAASLLMSHLHAIFRSLLSVGLPLTQLVERANHVFCESTLPSSFATLICGRADDPGRVELCSAGHCLPLLVQNGKVISVQVSGLPLGLFCETRYAECSIELHTGDALVVYTDGVTEARDPSGEEYGVDRLSRVLENCGPLPAQAIATACLEDLTAFVAGVPKGDDLTLLVLRRTGGPDQ